MLRFDLDVHFASRWKLCSEGEILFVFYENISLVLYPQSF